MFLTITFDVNLGTVLVSILLGALTAGLPLATRWFWGKVEKKLESHAADVAADTKQLGEQSAVFQETTLSTLRRMEDYAKADHAELREVKDQQNIHEGMLRVLASDWAKTNRPEPREAP